ncbi:hypothetical protein [Pimelobacter simplex]|uniref:hypothetical protein n=1 Tax=Nocardioides simplex TaxID=2045 RepID=UPI003AAD5A91
MKGLQAPPNRWTSGAVLCAGAALLAFIHSWPLAGWAYGDLAAMSAEFRQALLTTGLVASGVAAWVGSSMSSPTLAFAPSGAVRRGAPLAFSHLGFLWLAACVGYSVGLAPSLVATVVKSTYGSLDLASVASGYAGLLAYVAVGYLIGCLLPYFLAVPAALGVAYGLAFTTPTVLSPVFDFDVISGLEVPTRVSLVRIVFYLACAGAAAVAAAAWLRQRTPTEIGAAAISVVVVLIPIVAVAVGAKSYSTPLVVYDLAAADCTSSNGTQVCMHPARSELRAPLVRALDEVRAAVGPAVFPDVVVYDATLSAPPGSQPFELHVQGQDREAWLAVAVGDVVGHASGLAACNNLGSPEPAAYDASSAVAGWILAETGRDPTSALVSPEARAEYEELAALDHDDARRRIEASIDDVRRCVGALPASTG